LLGLSLLLAKRAEQGTGARQQATGAK
jgi:hypothetical protein